MSPCYPFSFHIRTIYHRIKQYVYVHTLFHVLLHFSFPIWSFRVVTFTCAIKEYVYSQVYTLFDVSLHFPFLGFLSFSNNFLQQFRFGYFIPFFQTIFFLLLNFSQFQFKTFSCLFSRHFHFIFYFYFIPLRSSYVSFPFKITHSY